MVDENWDCLEKLIFSISLLTFSFGMIFVCGTLSSHVYFIGSSNDPFLISVTASLAIVNIAISIVILLNTYRNRGYRNYFTNKFAENSGFVYFLSLPTVTVILTVTLLSIIRGIFHTPCDEGEGVIIYTTSFVFFVAVLILLLESNHKHDYGELEVISFSHMSTYLLTISGLIIHTFFYFMEEQNNNFLKIINTSTMSIVCEDSEGSIKGYIDSAWLYLQPYMFNSITLFSITTLIYFSKQFLKHYHFLQKFKVKENAETDVYVIHRTEMSECILTCIFIAAIVLFSTISIMLKVNSFLNTFFQYLYHTVSTMVLVSIMMSSFMLLTRIRSWQHASRTTFTPYHIMVGFGLCGQLFHSHAMLVASISSSISNFNELYMITLLKYILNIIQNIAESIVLWVILSKKWRQPSTENRKYILNLLFLLGSFNIVLGIADYCHINKSFIFPYSNNKPLIFFVKVFDNVGEIFGTFQRIFSAVIFLTLYAAIQTSNFRNFI